MVNFYDFSLILFILFHKQVQKSLCQALIKVAFSTEIFIVFFLPNITGGTQVQYPSKIRGFENFTGAFKSNKLNRGGDWSDYGQGGPMGFLFDASLVSEKYGASDSIQPSSSYALIMIKE